MLRIVNPVLWEMGHVAWFQEQWALRHLRQAPPVRADGDRLYDSSAVPHDARWTLPLPPLDDTLAYMARVLDDVRAGLQREGAGPPDPDVAYFHQLALFHEDMHAEALCYTRQTLGYPPPRLPGAVDQALPPAPALTGDAEIEATEIRLGSRPGAGFVFDNEKWAHPVAVG